MAEPKRGLTRYEMFHLLVENLRPEDLAVHLLTERDNEGQVVIYTGWYEHSDRLYYDHPEEEK